MGNRTSALKVNVGVTTRITQQTGGFESTVALESSVNMLTWYIKQRIATESELYGELEEVKLLELLV